MFVTLFISSRTLVEIQDILRYILLLRWKLKTFLYWYSLQRTTNRPIRTQYLLSYARSANTKMFWVLYSGLKNTWNIEQIKNSEFERNPNFEQIYFVLLILGSYTSNQGKTDFTPCLVFKLWREQFIFEKSLFPKGYSPSLIHFWTHTRPLLTKEKSIFSASSKIAQRLVLGLFSAEIFEFRL